MRVIKKTTTKKTRSLARPGASSRFMCIICQNYAHECENHTQRAKILRMSVKISGFLFWIFWNVLPNIKRKEPTKYNMKNYIISDYFCFLGGEGGSVPLSKSHKHVSKLHCNARGVFFYNIVEIDLSWPLKSCGEM
jgi:hypothetical protein